MPPAELKPFKLAVPDDQLDDLKRRISATRWPDQLDAPANANWEYGAEMTYLKSLADYWCKEYDWRAQEQIFNAMPQFTAKVNGLTMHFIHQPCTNSSVKAPALLLCHGWPGSIWEFHKVLRPLAEHFHLVVPSMPGYGFSEAPRKAGFSIPDAARTFHALMLELGYQEYVAQGGDWGSSVTQCLGRFFPENCKAVHINMPTAQPPEDFDYTKLTPAEMMGMNKTKDFLDYQNGYMRLQGTRPQTPAYGLNDSPVGLLAWIVEKFWYHSDHSGNVEDALTKDVMLTNVMIYWVSQSIGSSMRIYYESVGFMPGASKELLDLEKTKITVPTAVAQFPKDIYVIPKAFCEYRYNLQQYTAFETGGHFAALEKPEELVKDVKDFFLERLKLGTAHSKL